MNMLDPEPLPDLTTSDEASPYPEEVDDIAQSPKWGDEIPDGFGAEIEEFTLTRNKRSRKVMPVVAPKQNDHRDLVRAREDEAAREYDYLVSQEAMLEHRDEDKITANDTSIIEKQSPMCDEEVNPFSIADFSAEVAESGRVFQSAADELGSDFENDSDDLENETHITIRKDDFPVSPERASQSIIRNATGDAARDVPESMAENDTKSGQSQEPEIHDCQKCSLLEEELKARDRRIAILEAQIAVPTSKATNADASTNTETSHGQTWQSSYPRERSIEHQLCTSEQTASPPMVSYPPMQTIAVSGFIQACLDMARKLYLVLTNLVSMAAQPGRDLHLSFVGGPISFKEKAYLFKGLVWPMVIHLANPLWLAVNFVLFMSMDRERDTWIQANALTRKHLLKHTSGASTLWEDLFTLGSLAILAPERMLTASALGSGV